MKKSIYIFKSGWLKKKNNTLVLIHKNQEDISFPVETILDIHIFGDIIFNKRTLEFLTKNEVPMFIYNYYGYYEGTYFPRNSYNSGIIVLKQADHYLNYEKRLFLAKKFITGAIENILKNLIYYKKRKKQLESVIQEIQSKYKEIENILSIPELMAMEGEIRKQYYQSFNIIIDNKDFEFTIRSKKPPLNPINALISFGNSLLYVKVLSQIYRTYLDPRIGFLHETNQRSFSLNLDIAEIFKPILVDRVIFSLLNRGQIQLKHFEKTLNYCYLKEKGRKIFLNEFENKLKTTIKHKHFEKVSYRRIIRLECYKLYKHFLNEKEYKPFVSLW